MTEVAIWEFASLALFEEVCPHRTGVFVGTLGNREPQGTGPLYAGTSVACFGPCANCTEDSQKATANFLALLASREANTMQLPTVLKCALSICPREAEAIYRVMLAP